MTDDVTAGAPRFVRLRPLSLRFAICFGTAALALADMRMPRHATAEGSVYVRDVDSARVSLDTLTRATLARPERSSRLFVEGYFMRSLVASSEVLGTEEGPAISRAIAFADTLVAQQMPNGYWSIGYGSAWLADMGAALGIFHALEEHADSTRLRRYEAAAERFVAAMLRDRMIAASGAIGFGQPVADSSVVRAWRSDVGWGDDPYLISTALVGIELQAWLFHRTGERVYRDRALAALEYTLAQLGNDGALPSMVRGEGAYTVAAYVEEGWMAADHFLGDSDVHSRLCAALPRHVDWLLRTQREDGTWQSVVRGDFARTPGIVNFLIWYDQRCGAKREVQSSVQRAGAAFIEPARLAAGSLDTDELREIWRALLGRPLAALAAGKPVQ